jgi:hypothetical protein
LALLNVEKAVENHFTAKPPRAQRTCSKDKFFRLVKKMITRVLIQTLAFLWRLRVFAVEVLFQLRFLSLLERLT